MKDTQKQRNKVDVENKTKKSLVAKLTRERKEKSINRNEYRSPTTIR